MGLRRTVGWEARLAAVIEEARYTPYELGTHDCFRVACRAVEALTGVDLWSEWAGRYRTRREALRLIVEYGGDFDGAASRLFRVAAAAPALASRGDILKYVDPGTREPHLGVCFGRDAAVLGESGLLFVPVSACAACWKVG